jgi:cytochrome c peroxidase
VSLKAAMSMVALCSWASASAGSTVLDRLEADRTAAGRAASDSAFYADRFGRVPSAAGMAAVGRVLFRDPSLSASGRTACADCHSPRHAFGPPNGRPVQRGGAGGSSPGVRAVPSIRYLQNVPAFTEHYFDDDGDDSVDQGPAGGFTWDGRAQSAHDQARLPLLSPFEMGNTSARAVVDKLEHCANAAQFREVFGARVFEDPELAFRALLMALETYEQDPEEFYPYSSKYDAWLRGQASLTSEESRGLAAFNDPARGNCARCHPSGVRAGAFPQFTDFGFAALGVPRNPAIPANADRRYYDLGLCGPLRTDLQDRKEYCGLFRTPTLRNSAIRRVFFHNGALHRLTDVVRFYAERDTRPASWYPRPAGGGVRKFDDVPAAYRGNLDRTAPFDRHAGDVPRLSEGDVKAIVAFLNTLTDGYRP